MTGPSFINFDAVLREIYEPAMRREIKQAEHTLAYIEGFPSVEAWREHHAKEARRPINRLRRAKGRIQGRIVRAFINRWGRGWE